MATTDVLATGQRAILVEGGPNEGGSCTYTEDGTCLRHGEGAMKYFRPSKKMVKGQRRGARTMKYEKEWYYSCDLTPRGGRRRQPKLTSFLKTTVKYEDNPQMKTTVEEDKPFPELKDTAGIVGNLLVHKPEKSDDQ